MRPDSGKLAVLYDGACGFCRWSVAVLLRLDSRRSLRPVEIQSDEGQLLLAGLEPEQRLASAHVALAGGTVLSGGDAASAIAAALPGGRPVAALADALPGMTRSGYGFVAGKRSALGGLVGRRGRSWADSTIAERTGQVRH